MKTTHIYATDCDAHTACHSLALAVHNAFPASKLECTEHDSRGITCVHEGLIITADLSCPVAIRSITNREIEISVESSAELREEILAAVVASYKARKDAGGFTHSLERKI